MDEKKEYIGDWLDKLQRESWNLEGLVSTFQYINLNTALQGNVNGMARAFIAIFLLKN